MQYITNGLIYSTTNQSIRPFRGGRFHFLPLKTRLKKSERREGKKRDLIFTFVTAWIPARDFENLAGYRSVPFMRIALRSRSNEERTCIRKKEKRERREGTKNSFEIDRHGTADIAASIVPPSEASRISVARARARIWQYARGSAK